MSGWSQIWKSKRWFWPWYSFYAHLLFFSSILWASTCPFSLVTQVLEMVHSISTGRETCKILCVEMGSPRVTSGHWSTDPQPIHYPDKSFAVEAFTFVCKITASWKHQLKLRIGEALCWELCKSENDSWFRVEEMTWSYKPNRSFSTCTVRGKLFVLLAYAGTFTLCEWSLEIATWNREALTTIPV